MNTKAVLEVHKETNSSSFVQSKQIEAKYSLCDSVIKPKRFLATIESIATGTPDNIIKQTDAAETIANLPNLEQNRSRIDKLYRNTQIDTRHLAVNLLSDETIAFSRQHGNIQSRMQMYKEHAVPLAERVAKKALLTADIESDPLHPEKIEDSIRLIVFVTSTWGGDKRLQIYTV